MDALFGPYVAFVPWLVAGLAAMVMLFGATSSLSAARQARSAARDAERAASSLIQLHRETERLHAAWRDDLAGGRGGGKAPTPQPAPSATRTPAAVAATQPTTQSEPAQMEEATVMVVRPAAPVQPKDQFHGLPVLRVTVGADQGQEFKLPFERCSIGRANTNRVILDEAKASRLHAEVRFERHRFILKDADSTNGTLRNGVAVTEDALEFGDVVTIGKTDMLFTCEGFDLKDSEPTRAIAAFERLLEREPDFVPALQNLAFLLERDVARRREAEGVWKRLKRLEA